MTIDEMKLKKRELGYSNEKVSELSGVPKGTVQKIFSGETKSPRYETVQKLEKVLSQTKEATKYTIPPESVMLINEPSPLYGGDYYSYYKQSEKSYKKIHNADYSPVPIENRIGIAAGKFKIPDDSLFYDDEIAEMFDEL